MISLVEIAVIYAIGAFVTSFGIGFTLREYSPYSWKDSLCQIILMTVIWPITICYAVCIAIPAELGRHVGKLFKGKFYDH